MTALRKYLLVLCLSLMFKSAHSVGKCPTTLPNTVLREGETLTLPHQAGQRVAWYMAPPNAFFDILKGVTNVLGTLLPDFIGVCVLEDAGLTIVSASADPAGNVKYPSAGLYMLHYVDENCNTSAKVAVIKSGPNCSCVTSNKAKSRALTCSVEYSDTPTTRMFPIFNWQREGRDVQKPDRPSPKRISENRYLSTSELKTKGNNGLGTLDEWTCVLTFSAPPASSAVNMNTDPPDFVDSCSFSKNQCD